MTGLSLKRRMRNILIIAIIILALLIVRVGWIQFVQGKELQALAYQQQSLDRKVNPKRGTIYDTTGENILAVSSTVETVTINPTNISKENKEKVASALCDIFGLDYDTIYKKVNKRSSIETIVKKQEKEKTDKLRVWMQENQITEGINIDEDTKRYYPYNNLASHIIGFTGSDNQGLDGVEAKYNEVLSGTQGRITRVTDAKGKEIGASNEEYEEALDGNSLILTIDMNIQAIVEKYIEEACIDNVCTDGANVVIMNPNNGDILAMVTYPSYNLNDPYTINNEELLANWEKLSVTERNTALQGMWRNKAIADTYEPGSTFKLVTASASLEEGIVTNIDKEGEFTCTGGIEVAGTRIKCWRYYRPHGPESLRQALMNSCNPVFVGLGQRVGVEKYYDYLEKFGFLDKTGIDLPGEAKGIFLDESKVGPIELATISFGQRFEITPLQMVTAVSAIANGGNLVQPRVVRQIINSQTGEKQDIETIVKHQVISKETSEKVLNMMGSVVAEGTGKNAQVKGYELGGKTGTSEDGVNTNKYVTSFIGVATINNPELVILITLYNPTGEGGHQGGGVAAPIASQILGEVLPYLELKKDKEGELEEEESVTMPNIRNMNIKEAKKILKQLNLNLEINGKVDEKEIDIENTYIKEQTPKPGIKINTGSSVFVDLT